MQMILDTHLSGLLRAWVIRLVQWWVTLPLSPLAFSEASGSLVVLGSSWRPIECEKRRSAEGQRVNNWGTLESPLVLIQMENKRILWKRDCSQLEIDGVYKTFHSHVSVCADGYENTVAAEFSCFTCCVHWLNSYFYRLRGFFKDFILVRVIWWISFGTFCHLLCETNHT